MVCSSEDCEFGEYGTKDLQGNSLTPASNVITLKGKTGTKTVQTTLTADAASRFTIANVFPLWRPDLMVKELEKKCQRWARKYF